MLFAQVKVSTPVKGALADTLSFRSNLQVTRMYHRDRHENLFFVNFSITYFVFLTDILNAYISDEHLR